MTLATDRRMTLAEYLDYDDGTDTRYELEDGVLVEMGAESHENIAIAMLLLEYFLVVLRISRQRLTLKTEIAVPLGEASTRYPDLIVLSEDGASALKKQPRSLITFDMPAPMLVVEVVSNSDTDKKSRDRDYTLKRSEYAERGIPEYWIVDPVAAVVLVLHLDGGKYEEQRFTGDRAILSPAFPALTLTAAQILTAGM
jgi:Uma2 family endonuclease